MIGKGMLTFCRVGYNCAASSTAACTASRCAPSWIWWRQLVPSATTIAPGVLAHGRQQAQLGHLHRHVVVAGLVAEAARHAAAAAFDQLGLHAGNQLEDFDDRRHRARKPSGGSGRAEARACPADAASCAAPPAGRPASRAPGIPRTAGPARPPPARVRPGPWTASRRAASTGRTAPGRRWRCPFREGEERIQHLARLGPGFIHHAAGQVGAAAAQVLAVRLALAATWTV